jgi:tetratricopeptide (TPR) repeat protein
MGFFDPLFRKVVPAPVNPNKEKAQELVNEAKLKMVSDGSFQANLKNVALDIVNRALVLDPECADAWGFKGCLLGLHSGKELTGPQDAEALNCLERALALDPKDTAAWFHKGSLLKNAGKNAEALACFNLALEGSPAPQAFMKDMILLGKGGTLEMLGQNTEALLVYDKIAVSRSCYGDSAERKGFIFEKMGNTDEAFKWFSVAAYVHHEVKEREKSRKCLDQCLRIKPADKLILYTKGTLLLEMNTETSDISALKEAYEYFKTLLEQEPKNTMYLNSVGVCLIRLKRFDEGLEKYETGLILNPKDDLLLKNKAQCLISLNRFDEALSCLQEMIKIKPGDHEPWIQCALIHQQLGKYTDALRDADQVLSIIGDKPMSREFWRQSLQFRIEIQKKLGRFNDVRASEAKLNEITASRFPVRPYTIR